MDETMKNTEVEVTTEVSGAEDVSQEITIETKSGPSKGFVALVVGGVVAAAVGATVAIKRHKKKKANAREEDEFDEVFGDDDLVEVERAEVKTAEVETVNVEITKK